MTRLLAFDTSTEAMSIALCLAEHTLVFEGNGGAQASDRLIPEIHALLARGGCTLKEMDAIGFGRGPGAFTGLRTACAVAQGLALGTGKPVLPLDSLMLVAQDAAEPDVWVAMDARMNEIYAAHYQRPGPREPWHTRVAPALYSLEALHSLWQATPPPCVAGSAIEAFGAALKVGNARTLPVARSRAAALAELARAAWQQGEAVDVALALPVYLRDKVAQTTAERDAARAAREGVS